MTMVSTASMVAARISNCSHSGRLVVMNWGSTATMKMMPLGLVALVRKPVSTRRRTLSSGMDSWAARGAAPERHWLMPR